MPHNTPHRTDHAPIVHRSDTDICFSVDEVMPCERRLSYTNARQQFEKRLGRPLQAFSHDESSDIVLEQAAIEHSLVAAVHLAFSQHRPLVLTPDAIWITLAQGFSQHLNLHAEALRSRLVSHKGKVTMEASAFELATPQDWNEVIQQWSTGIQPHVPAELYQLILCDFSTTTPIVRTASQVVMLDAFQQYFDYALSFICGIPAITVKGTMQDWLSICSEWMPTGLSRAPFIIKSPGQPGKEMELMAGFIGVKQESKTGQLEPEIGWAVLEQDETSRVFTLLISAAVPGQPPQKEAMPRTEQESQK